MAAIAAGVFMDWFSLRQTPKPSPHRTNRATLAAGACAAAGFDQEHGCQVFRFPSCTNCQKVPADALLTASDRAIRLKHCRSKIGREQFGKDHFCDRGPACHDCTSSLCVMHWSASLRVKPTSTYRLGRTPGREGSDADRPSFSVARSALWLARNVQDQLRKSRQPSVGAGPCRGLVSLRL
jgi:hypothetical protein